LPERFLGRNLVTLSPALPAFAVRQIGQPPGFRGRARGAAKNTPR
jgi:hypothetical protein